MTIRAKAVLAGVLLAAGAARAAPAGSPWNESYFTNVELTTHEGRKVRFYDDLIRDKHVVVSFIFVNCTRQCGLITANLARVQRELGDRVGKDVFFYSITMDPERDTPEVLARYARSFKAGPGWVFLTGKEEEVQQIRQRFGDMRPRDDHAATINIGNDLTGQWWHTGAVDNPKYLAKLVGDWMDPRFKGNPKARSYAEARLPAQRLSKGQELFRDNCLMCHLPGEPSVGPDLRGIAARRDGAWLQRWMRDPGKLVARKDPLALSLLEQYGDVLMPTLELKPADWAEITRFLEGYGPAPTPSPEAGTQAASERDPGGLAPRRASL